MLNSRKVVSSSVVNSTCSGAGILVFALFGSSGFLLFYKFLWQLTYQELETSNQKIWIPELNLGLGLCQGEYKGVTRQWLRWYDKQGNWFPTENEIAAQEHQRAERERQRAEQERQRAEQAEALLAQERQQRELLAERLRAMGINPDEILG